MRILLAGEDILTFARTRLGFQFEDNQIPLLVSDARWALVNCSRQFGKSTLTAIKVIYQAFARPGCLILVAGPSDGPQPPTDSADEAVFKRPSAQANS